MSNEFTQAELDAMLEGNTVDELRKNFVAKGHAISAYDVRSKYVEYLEKHCIGLRAATLKHLFKTIQNASKMAEELEVQL